MGNLRPQAHRSERKLRILNLIVEIRFTLGIKTDIKIERLNLRNEVGKKRVRNLKFTVVVIFETTVSLSVSRPI